jgi:transcription initiation factor TFIIF subunit beta
MADIKIKPDPDAQGASPSTFSDEDLYEDAGDLEFNNAKEYQDLYLAKIPKFMYEAWEKLDDDAEIQIGTVRQIDVKNPDGTIRVWSC